MTHKSLLVIDWDYFFPTPWEGGFESKEIRLYDWSHAESNLYIDMMWPIRAATFFSNNLPLPPVESSWKTFPERFHLDDDAVVYVADSNAHAGLLEDSDGDPFSDLWLYDAHHDAGYGVKSYAEWMARHVTRQGTNFSCEDWMLVHYMQGTQLHWRIPTWHENFKRRLENGSCDEECDHPGVAHGAFWPEGIEIDAKIDDLQPVQEEFDAVMICRSGAWVPAWEDYKFERFIESWDRDVMQLDNYPLIRDFDAHQAEVEAKQLKDMMKEFQ